MGSPVQTPQYFDLKYIYVTCLYNPFERQKQPMSTGKTRYIIYVANPVKCENAESLSLKLLRDDLVKSLYPKINMKSNSEISLGIF